MRAFIFALGVVFAVAAAPAAHATTTIYQPDNYNIVQYGKYQTPVTVIQSDKSPSFWDTLFGLNPPNTARYADVDLSWLHVKPAKPTDDDPQ
ncbi:MAG: hypothetical protein KGI97_06865 [Alphaproteobacteria bacterium]|nr:hypothetical protein [Alphaproteobacteria bacterium]